MLVFIQRKVSLPLRCSDTSLLRRCETWPSCGAPTRSATDSPDADTTRSADHAPVADNPQTTDGSWGARLVQVRKLELEIESLGRQLESQREQQTSLAAVWERQVAEAGQRADREAAKATKSQDELVEAYAQLHQARQQVSIPHTS